MATTDTATRRVWLKVTTGCDWEVDEERGGYFCAEHNIFWAEEYVKTATMRLVTPTATVAQERKEG
jgi:hypothetical protein